MGRLGCKRTNGDGVSMYDLEVCILESYGGELVGKLV